MPFFRRLALRRRAVTAVVAAVVGTSLLVTPASAHADDAVSRAEAPVRFTVGPEMFGGYRVGQYVRVMRGITEPREATHTFEWKVNGQVVGTGEDYLLKAADVNKRVAVTQTSTAPGYASASATSFSWGVEYGDIPTGLIEIVGSPVVGSSLSFSPLPLPTSTPTTPTFRWFRDGVEMTDETGSSYDLTLEDLDTSITAQLHLSAPGYRDLVLPMPASRIGKGAIGLEKPEVSGTPRVGSPLKAVTSRLTPDTTLLTYEWFRGRTPVGTGAAYTPTIDDLGSQLTVAVTASADGYTTRVETSERTPSVGAGQLTPRGSVWITGAAVVGDTLTGSSDVTTEPASTVTSTWWERNGRPVPDATGSTYELTAADEGKQITYVEVRSLAGREALTSRSKPTSAVAPGSIRIDSSPPFNGVYEVGQTLTWPSPTTTPATTETVTWLRDDVPIAGATGTTYVLTVDDLGHTVSGRKAMTRPGYMTRNLGWPGHVVRPGRISLGSPAISGTPQVGRALRAVDGTIAPTDTTVTYQWLRDDVEIGTGSRHVVDAADLGGTITVRAKATKEGYDDASAVSDGTTPVAAGQLTTTGAVAVTGAALVGTTLTSSSDVATTPPAQQVSRQWFRGESPIDGAVGDRYTLTNADASQHISVRETHTVPGYEAVTRTGTVTNRVTGGVIRMDPPVVHSTTLAVGDVLFAEPGQVSPSDAAVSFSWQVGDGESVAGRYYTITADDIGKKVTLTATAGKPDHDPVSTTRTPVNPIAAATFTRGPAPTVSGVLKVGELLTVNEGVATPAASSYAYQWLADGVAIDGATGRTLKLTSAHEDARISVRVTAQRVGHVDSIATSEAPAPVASDRAPSLSLRGSTTQLRTSESLFLGWTSDDATSVVASGDWSGPRPGTGLESITAVRAGARTYTLTATNDRGTTTAQVAVAVTPAARTLRIGTKSSVRKGRALTVKTSGLEPGEAYTIRLGGTIVASGTASAKGQVSRTVSVPAKVGPGPRELRITGSVSDRTGAKKIRVTAPKKSKKSRR
jgi:hypothetical protein